MPDLSDVALLALLLFVVMFAFIFPGGPGTPLRMKAQGPT
jgi:hypothetical protein